MYWVVPVWKIPKQRNGDSMVDGTMTTVAFGQYEFYNLMRVT